MALPRPVRRTLVGTALLLPVSVALIAARPTYDALPARAIVETRSYHIVPERLDVYRTWIRDHGLPYFHEHFDVVGFWVDGGIEPEVTGIEMDALGSANVTWMLRWESKAQRDEVLGRILSTPEWRSIFSRLDGGMENYLHLESRFLESVENER